MKDKTEKLIANGEFALVQGHRLHVSRSGKEAGPKIVIMSGAGVPAPVYDYKVLYEKLEDEFRIIVIEKFGYGYSDLYECPCDIDSLVDMQREALGSLGESGPFILLPHSMSGLEALRWKQRYPEEIRAIIGLDMAIPAEYAQWTPQSMKLRVQAMKLLPALKKLGLTALYPLNTRCLSEDEKRQQKLLIDRNLMGKNIMNEAAAVLENARKVGADSLVECPMLLFVSNGKQVSKHWVDNQREFTEQTKAEAVFFDCGHCIHYYESETVSKKIKEFIRQLEKGETI